MKRNHQFRHGDVMIASVKKIPKDAKKLKTNIVVRGEITGHAHRLSDLTACQLFSCEESLYLDVSGNFVKIVHEEHKEIEIPKGQYRIWVQREYTPAAIRRVVD